MRKFKKVTAMVCALMMSAMLFAALPVGAAESLVQNGDFSLGLDGWVAGKGATVDMEADNPRLEVGAQTDVTSVPMPIVAGKKYVINYKVESPLDQLRTYIRWLGEDAKFMGDAYVVDELVTGVTPGSWVEKITAATAPVGAHYMEFRFNIYKYESNTPTYIDDVTVTVTENLIVNGDFEKGSGSTATSWNRLYTTSGYGWGTTQSWVAPTETEGGYVSIKGGDSKIGGITQNVQLMTGVQYKLQFKYKSSTSDGVRFYINDTPAAYWPNNSTANTTLSKTDGNWVDHTFYFTVNTTKEYAIVFGERSKNASTDTYVSAVSLTVVEQTVAFYDAEGEKTEEIEEARSAQYNGCGKNVLLMVATYKKLENNVLMLEDISTEEGTSTVVKEKSYATTPSVCGDIPFTLELPVDTSKEGEYIYKAFVWDGTTPIQSLKTAMRATLQ